MSKGWKIFFKILYFFFAFGVGIFLILVVPPAKRDELSFKYLNNYVENKEFVKAVDLLSYVYNADDISNDTFENNSGLVIFEGLSIYTETVEEKTTSVLNNSYVGIIYNLDKLSFYGNDNKSILKINDKNVEILLYDYDGDGTLDSVPSLINSTYLCFTVNKEEFTEFNSIELVQKDGETYLKKENLGLTFESDFFTAVENYVTKYNFDLEDNVFSTSEELELLAEFDNVHKLNSNYQMLGTYKTAEKVFDEANIEAFWFLFGFIIWAWILGDCLVGKRYTFQLIKTIFLKIKSKIKPSKVNNEAIGSNFFSLVTFKAELCEGFDKDIIISYECPSDKQYNFKVIVGKNDNYLIKQRVRGGKYRLTKVECAEYQVSNLPEEIEVKGYTMLIEFNISK